MFRDAKDVFHIHKNTEREYCSKVNPLRVTFCLQCMNPYIDQMPDLIAYCTRVDFRMVDRSRACS